MTTEPQEAKMTNLTPQGEMTEDQQAALQAKAAKYEQKVMEKFQLELGRLNGQALVNTAQHEMAVEEMKEREQEYLKVIEQLTTEVQSLREAAGVVTLTEPPAEPGDEPVDISKAGKARKRT